MTATWKCLTLCVLEEINKQQQFFLSEYHLQEINSREIYPHSTFSSKRNKCTKVWKNANSFSGFAQSLEFLKKSWNLPSNFPNLEKVWKTVIKFGKMVKSLHFFQSYSEYFLSGIFFVLVKSYSISPVRLQRIIRKSFVPAFFLSLYCSPIW